MKHPSHIISQKNNHPKEGSCISVEPIRRLEDIEAIKNLLRGNPRNFLLFIMGINNGLRAGDLLKLKSDQFRNVDINSKIPIMEQKTKKPQEVVINQPIKEALEKYFSHNGSSNFLFQSQKGDFPISVSVVNSLVKSWCKKIGLTGNYGSHTLRKTFGYVLRRHYKVSWEIISKRYNHSSPGVTRSYLGIQDEEVNDIIVKCPI